MEKIFHLPDEFHLDKNGVEANCEKFQINDRSGSKLVAIDSSQIQIYTNDLAIINGLHFYDKKLDVIA